MPALWADGARHILALAHSSNWLMSETPRSHGTPDKFTPDHAVGLASLLGIDVREASASRVVAVMEVTSQHHQPFGFLHGGASVAIAETAASIGAYLAAPEGQVAMGMEINANHVRAVRGGVLTAEATPVHVGRTSQVWGVEIRDAHGQLVCISRCTLAVVEPR